MWFQKISILPPQKGLEIPGRRGGGVSKTPKFKAMYEVKLEFPEGWGGHRANPFCGGGGGGGGGRGGYGYFLEPHIFTLLPCPLSLTNSRNSCGLCAVSL